MKGSSTTIGLVALVLLAVACAAPAQPAATAKPAAPAQPAATAAPAQPKPAADQAAKKGSEKLIEAALKTGQLNDKREGALNWWSTSPTDEVVAKLVEAFNKRFGLNVKANRVPVSAGDFVTRIKAGAQAGKIDADIGQGAVSSQAPLDEAGLLDSFDWVGTFGSEFKDMQKRVDRVMPAYRNKVLDYNHMIYVIGYRTDRVKKEELPKNWDALADPKFKGRVGLAKEGYPFSYLAPFWGKEKAIAQATKLRDNGARFFQGSPGVETALVSGEVDLGLTTSSRVEADKAKGAPVDWVPPDELAVVQLNMILPKGLPHPDLAHLFGAWLTTEGRALYGQLAKEEMIWPDEDYPLAKRAKELGVKLLSYETVDQAMMTTTMEQEISKLYMR